MLTRAHLTSWLVSDDIPFFRGFCCCCLALPCGSTTGPPTSSDSNPVVPSTPHPFHLPPPAGYIHGVCRLVRVHVVTDHPVFSLAARPAPFPMDRRRVRLPRRIRQAISHGGKRTYARVSFSTSPPFASSSADSRDRMHLGPQVHGFD